MRGRFHARPHRTCRVADQLRRVGDRRLLGRGRRRGVDARAARGDRRGRQLHRYRRCLRRGSQRTAGRASSSGASRRDDSRRDQGRTQAAGPDSGRVYARQPDRLDRREPEESANGDDRPLTAPLPASGCLQHVRTCSRCSTSSSRRGSSGTTASAWRPSMRRDTPSGTRTCSRSRSSSICSGRSRPRVLRRGGARQRRHHRPRAARQWSSHGQAVRVVVVRGRRSPQLQSAGRAIRSRRDVFRRAVRRGTRGGRGIAPARAGGRYARHSSRCAGS